VNALEERYSSNDPREVERVYKFSNEEIMRWMRTRPSAKIEVKREANGDVVVVIPTKSVNSPLAREAREVFKPLPVVFVESSGKYFNYARSVNAGIERVMEYRPKWVVVSNDDVHKVDDAKKLVDALATTNRVLVMARPSAYHTYQGVHCEAH
jgi:hypothetical protein